MNMYRERVFFSPRHQIWWMRRGVAALLELGAPDFVSWVELRLSIEAPAYRDDFFWPAPAIRQTLEIEKKSDTGSAKDQYAVVRESVRLARERAAKDRVSSLPELAAALEKLASTAGDLGQYDDALNAIHEAIYCCRQLAHMEPEKFRPELARMLADGAEIMKAAVRPREALVAGWEAVLIYRDLAEADPGKFLPPLAKALGGELHRVLAPAIHDTALEMVREVVRIGRHLAGANPRAFAILANSLNSLFMGRT
jgi:hypothetical protein